MKNILKISTLFFTIAALWSCTNDKDPVVSSGGFQVRKDVAVVGPAVFSEANKTESFAKLDWDRSNNGPATQSKYFISVSDHDADPNFEHPYETDLAVNPDPDSRTATMTVDNFNTMINQLASFNCGPMNIDIRIKSELGVPSTNPATPSNTFYQYSNPITVAVTGYPKTPLILAFVKDAGNPADAQKVITSSYDNAADYDGYMYLEAGNYKFYKPDACGDFATPVIYGLTAGALVQGGSDSFVVATAGHYLVKANLVANTYTISPFTSFGIFGAAKGIPLGVNRAMTYNATNKKWELTFELYKGRKFRFRSVNGAVGVSVLGASTSSSTPNALEEFPVASTSGGDLRVPGTDDGTKQNYNITLDTNNPRNYTYTLELNPN